MTSTYSFFCAVSDVDPVANVHEAATVVIESAQAFPFVTLKQGES